MTADQEVKYGEGVSCIVYIGQTGRGLRRVSASAAARAQSAFDQRGIRRIAMWPITWGEEQDVEVASKLERALLIEFRERFGEPPLANVQGARMKLRDESEWFTPRAVAALIQRFSHVRAH